MGVRNPHARIRTLRSSYDYELQGPNSGVKVSIIAYSGLFGVRDFETLYILVHWLPDPTDHRISGQTTIVHNSELRPF